LRAACQSRVCAARESTVSSCAHFEILRSLPVVQ
jgi:hypothetical protein